MLLKSIRYIIAITLISVLLFIAYEFYRFKTEPDYQNCTQLDEYGLQDYISGQEFTHRQYQQNYQANISMPMVVHGKAIKPNMLIAVYSLARLHSTVYLGELTPTININLPEGVFNTIHDGGDYLGFTTINRDTGLLCHYSQSISDRVWVKGKKIHVYLLPKRIMHKKIERYTRYKIHLEDI